MLTMRPVRLYKNFPRELVNTSLKKYLGQHALRGIAGNNPSVRKSRTRNLHRPHSAPLLLLLSIAYDFKGFTNKVFEARDFYFLPDKQ